MQTIQVDSKFIANKNIQLIKRSLQLIFLFFALPSLLLATVDVIPMASAEPGIIFYIANSWKSLQRSVEDCNTFTDPKTHLSSILYLPYDFPLPENIAAIQQSCHLTVKHLPKKITTMGELDGDKIQPSGLLYLPRPYIVPGGMFNEMYGWDSYFIIRGLIEAKKTAAALDMLENFFFEIDHYGGILNGNRTYYLTRTQLPFLAPTIRKLYEADSARKFTNLAWLEKAYQYAEKDYRLWTSPPHLAGKTGLSRYYDFGNGPVSEMAQSESYYADIVRYFLLHPKLSHRYLQYQSDDKQTHIGDTFTLSICPETKNNTDCKIFKNISLTDYFYKGDRAMRASGFDTSFRFGPFSADTVDYAPVDLNSLLYKAEKDLEWMSSQLDKPMLAKRWAMLAKKRSDRINRYLWNAKKGFYYDFNFVTKQQSIHPYASTFYPLWAGIASMQQAKSMIGNLKHFEKSGGIVTSLRHTGVQWDYPYGWAPLQLIAVEGLYQYGFKNEANRISHKFLKMVLKNYLRDKTIHEKYDVVSGTSQTDIKIGYKLNVIGFGWTNGVFLVLLNKLPEQLVKEHLSQIDQTQSFIQT